jgi:copper(I)-binding protein
MKIPRKLLPLAAAASLCLASLAAHGHEYYTKSFVIIHPWAEPTDKDVTSAIISMKIDEVTADDKLITATMPLAAAVELRAAAPKSAAGASALLQEIRIPAGALSELRAEGNHLVLTGLSAPLQWGRSYPMILKFEKSGDVPVMISIGAH